MIVYSYFYGSVSFDSVSTVRAFGFAGQAKRLDIVDAFGVGPLCHHQPVCDWITV